MNKQLIIVLVGTTALVAIYFATSAGDQLQSTSQSNVNNPQTAKEINDTSAKSIKVSSVKNESKRIKNSNDKDIKTESLSHEEVYEHWTKMKELLENGEINVALEKQLIDFLKQNNDLQIYTELMQLLQIPDSNLESRNQEYLLSLLASINTKESVSLLLGVLEEGLVTDSNAIYVAKKSLKKITQSATHINLLENSFSNMTSDNIFLTDVTRGIARNASEQNFDFLVTQVNAANEKSPVALTSIGLINSEKLVPKLQQTISSNSPEAKLSIASLNALANMGKYEASVALIQWSSKQPSSNKVLVKHLFTKATQKSPSTYRAIEKQLNKHNFASTDIKTVIENAYAKK
ncbi:hypothetical protein [Shewanella pneumatophori]|uniref:HEAT repeat domain-containing protein n=1 Tax=Shewanella pneumatophori TaxID=314092 RepID=A0A9X1Z9Y4_9GAMM|nr:hypothetical protein [Shewanella pneumatophori]MCL1137693.1 hypothetical protein [Shewanella pneumatophori]